MMNYELGNGKTIRISFEDWLNLDDEKLQALIAKDAGVDIQDIFSENCYKDFDSTNIKEVEPLDDQIVEQIKKQIDESD